MHEMKNKVMKCLRKVEGRQINVGAMVSCLRRKILYIFTAPTKKLVQNLLQLQ